MPVPEEDELVFLSPEEEPQAPSAPAEDSVAEPTSDSGGPEASSEEEADAFATVGSVWSSTPSRKGAVPSPRASPIIGSPRICRRETLRKIRRRPARLNYTDEMEIPIPPEPNHRTKAKWKQRLAFLLRYVDDGFSLAKINFENSLGFTINGQKHRVKHAAQSQNVFRPVSYTHLTLPTTPYV